jgi:lysophospholipase L1-like esterase
MLRRERLGALALLGLTSFIDTIACSSATNTGVEGTGGFVVGGGGMTPIPGGGGAGAAMVPSGYGGSTPGGGGTGNVGNKPNVGGTGNTAIGGSGNAVSTGGSMVMAGGAAGAAGMSGSAGVAGAAGGGGGGASGAGNTGGAAGMPMMTQPPCLTTPASDVLIMGDSYVTGALSPALQPALGMLYPAANQFRNVAVAGVSMANGGIGALVPTQFTGKPKLVIMDGGGNDILLCDAIKFAGCGTMCNKAGSSSLQICKDIVAQATAAAGALFDKMSAAGVSDIVYFFYPHPPTNGGGMKEIDDYSEPIARAQCEAYGAKTNGKTNCYWVSTVKPFADAGGDINPANFVADGIHPSQAGQNIIAKLINDTLKAHCLAQPSSSGCCK